MSKNKSDLNALVQSGDKRVTISAADVTTKPTTKDLVIISSVRHQIVDIKKNLRNIKYFYYCFPIFK